MFWLGKKTDSPTGSFRQLAEPSPREWDLQERFGNGPSRRSKSHDGDPTVASAASYELLTCAALSRFEAGIVAKASNDARNDARLYSYDASPARPRNRATSRESSRDRNTDINAAASRGDRWAKSRQRPDYSAEYLRTSTPVPFYDWDEAYDKGKANARCTAGGGWSRERSSRTSPIQWSGAALRGRGTGRIDGDVMKVAGKTCAIRSPSPAPRTALASTRTPSASSFESSKPSSYSAAPPASGKFRKQLSPMRAIPHHKAAPFAVRPIPAPAPQPLPVSAALRKADSAKDFGGLPSPTWLAAQLASLADSRIPRPDRSVSGKRRSNSCEAHDPAGGSPELADTAKLRQRGTVPRGKRMSSPIQQAPISEILASLVASELSAVAEQRRQDKLAGERDRSSSVNRNTSGDVARRRPSPVASKLTERPGLHLSNSRIKAPRVPVVS